MAVALADLTCRAMIEYDFRHLQIEHPRQEDFVDANSDELTELG